MRTYKSTEIQKLIGVTKMQAVHWSQTGAVVPYKDARGRGSSRLYNWQNIVEMMICRELGSYAVETRFMLNALEYLRSKRAGDGVSFWKLLKQDPRTKRVFLVFTKVQIEGRQVVEVGPVLLKFREVYTVLQMGRPSLVIINIEALINELIEAEVEREKK